MSFLSVYAVSVSAQAGASSLNLPSLGFMVLYWGGLSATHCVLLVIDDCSLVRW